ncbi:MAG: hypothetical protein JW754_02835 [Candidatus Aenigmarchaeota archaeon]|nr:hypothetical protein [Candidatus Aenigmarchaeota archaeon]
MVAKYLISTTMGDSFLDPTGDVYVQVSPSSYLKKKVADVNVGDMVLFQKPYAKTDLEDVEPHLDKSPRYHFSKEMIHEQNSRGDFIPRLRTLLLKGLSEKGVIDDSDIDSRALYETDDFAKEDYEMMAEWVVNALERNGKKRHVSTVENWLRGETLAPRDWEIFNVLGREINPEFNDFREYEDDPKSMYFNYQLYVNIRRGIMRYLNDCRGTTRTFENQPKEEPHISLSPEYAIVFQHFMSDRNETHATARVTEIQKILKRHQMEHVKKTNEFLGEGIVSGEMKNMLELLKSYKDVMEYDEMLESMICSFVEDFDYRISEDDNIVLPSGHVTSNRFWRHAISTRILPTILRCFDEDIDDFMKYLEKGTGIGFWRNFENEDVQKFREAVRKGFLDRGMDSQFRYSSGTSANLLEVYYRIHKAIPERVFRYLAKAREFYTKVVKDTSNFQRPGTEPRIFPDGRRVLIVGAEDPSKIDKVINQLRLREEAELIENRYGIGLNMIGMSYEGGLFFSDEISQSMKMGFDPVTHRKMDKLISGREYIEKFGDEKTISELNSMEKNPGVFYLTRNDVYKMLKEFHLQKIIDRRWQDFVWEDV